MTGVQTCALPICIDIVNATGAFATGNGTMVVTVFYSIITLN